MCRSSKRQVKVCSFHATDRHPSTLPTVPNKFVFFHPRLVQPNARRRPYPSAPKQRPRPQSCCASGAADHAGAVATDALTQVPLEPKPTLHVDGMCRLGSCRAGGTSRCEPHHRIAHTRKIHKLSVLSWIEHVVAWWRSPCRNQVRQKLRTSTSKPCWKH